MKKSGLADSPFFSSPPPDIQVETAYEAPIQPKSQVMVYPTQEENPATSIINDQPKENLASKKEIFLAFLLSCMEMKAATTVSFRYPQDLLDQLEEAVYEIKKQHRKKVTKNALLVTALAYLLWEYENKGEMSILYQHLIKE